MASHDQGQAGSVRSNGHGGGHATSCDESKGNMSNAILLATNAAAGHIGAELAKEYINAVRQYKQADPNFAWRYCAAMAAEHRERFREAYGWPRNVDVDTLAKEVATALEGA